MMNLIFRLKQSQVFWSDLISRKFSRYVWVYLISGLTIVNLILLYTLCIVILYPTVFIGYTVGLRKTDTLGTWLLSAVENCLLLGDWSIFLSKHPICIILNAVLHVLKWNSYGRSHKLYYIMMRMNILRDE